MIHVDTFCNSNFFFPIADLKKLKLCNVIQQIKKSGLIPLHLFSGVFYEMPRQKGHVLVAAKVGDLFRASFCDNKLMGGKICKWQTTKDRLQQAWINKTSR